MNIRRLDIGEVMPDLITMDMTLPDGDGIRCSKTYSSIIKMQI